MAFINGVDTAASQITSLGTQVGSYLGDVGASIEVSDIIVAKNGAVVKVASAVDVNTYSYTVLLGDDTLIQAGHEYPNVVRVLKDDGGISDNSEWWYYDNGGEYPWPGVDESLSFKLVVSTSAPAESFTLPLRSEGSYNFIVQWGDGTSDIITTHDALALAHPYADAGNHTIIIDGTCSYIWFNNSGDRLKMVDIQQWGDVGWDSLNSSFYGCSNMVITATDAQNLNNVTSWYQAFRSCSQINPDFSAMSPTPATVLGGGIFRSCSKLTNGWGEKFNQVPGSTDQGNMYRDCGLMSETDVSGWYIADQTQVNNIFYNANDLLSVDVSQWDTSNCAGRVNTFNRCALLDPDISMWDVSALTDASGMMELSGFSTTNYDKFLKAAALQQVQPNVPFHAGSAQYSNDAISSREILIAQGWTFTDGGPAANQVWFNPAGSNTSPYDTKAKGATLMSTAMAQAAPGDLCTIVDGTYSDGVNGWDIAGTPNSSAFWNFTTGDSGTNGNPIVWKAETDGGVVLDSEFTWNTLVLGFANDITFHGFVFRNGMHNNMDCVNSQPCARIKSYRCTYWDVDLAFNDNHHSVSITDADEILFEDCGIGGNTDFSTGRNPFIFYRCSNSINRRMYVLLRGWQGDTGSGNGMGQVYNSSGNIVENMTGTGIQPVGDTNPLTGLNNWGNEIAASNNHYYGCAVYNLDQNPSIYSNGTAFADSAAVAGGNTNVTYTDMAVVNCKRWAFGGGNNTTDWGGGDYGTRLRNCTVYSATNATSGGHTKVGFRDNSSYPNGSKNVRNCIADTMWNGIEDNSGVAVSEYNCYWNCNNVYTGSTPISPPGTGDTTVIDPAWDTATFGTGAYLMPPAALAGLGEGGTDMGADVRYCYVDGALTTKRLWPWPMEGRIAAEAGVSATYEVDPGGSAATTFIGPWKTLAGVYP